MDDVSIGALPSAFNASTIRALDPEFWSYWDCWQSVRNVQCGAGSIAFNDMLGTMVRSAPALMAKIQALRDMPEGCSLDHRMANAYTYRDVLEWDAERVAKRELLALSGVGSGVGTP